MTNLPFRKRVIIWIKKNDLFVVGKRWQEDKQKYVHREAGGGIEDNQSIEQAASIEALEELGVSIKNVKKFDCSTYKFDWFKYSLLQKFKKGDPRLTKMKKRMKLYRGFENIPIIAEFNKKDLSLFHRDNDGMETTDVSKQELIDSYNSEIIDPDFNSWKINILLSLS